MAPWRPCVKGGRCAPKRDFKRSAAEALEYGDASRYLPRRALTRLVSADLEELRSAGALEGVALQAGSQEGVEVGRPALGLAQRGAGPRRNQEEGAQGWLLQQRRLALGRLQRQDAQRPYVHLKSCAHTSHP